jgi:hypothetical protein
MDTFRSIKDKTNHTALFNKSVKKASYCCLHVHIRYIKDEHLHSIFNNILSMNDHNLSMKVIMALYNTKSRNTFLGLYLDKLIKSFLEDSSIQSAEKIKNCKDIIALCSLDLLKAISKEIIKKLSLEQFKKIIKLLDMKCDILMELTIYGCYDIIDFMTGHSTGFSYKEETVINFIIDMLNNNDNIDFNKLKWIIENYKECLNKNLLHMVSSVKKFSVNNNSYIIIDYLFFLMKISHQDIYKIFKRIIYDANEILFCYMSIKFFSRVKDFNYFEYVCLFSNPDSDLNNNLIGLAYVKSQLEVDKLDDIFKKVCKYKIVSAIKWFTTFLPERYNTTREGSFIIESGTVKPIVSPFYMDKKCKYIQQKDNSECCVCFDNKPGMIQLNCHTSHIICSECLETTFNIKKLCPLCRADINIQECIIYL